MMQKGQVPFSLHETGQVLIFLLVGILIIAVVGGAYYLGRSTSPKPSSNPVVISQTSQPTPDPSSSDETANWKTYRNENFGFEVKYPSEWMVKDLVDYVYITNGSLQFQVYPEGNGRGLYTTPTRESEITIGGIVGNRRDFITQDNQIFFSLIEFNGYTKNNWHPEYNYILLDGSSQVDFGDSSIESMSVRTKDLTDFKTLDKILYNFKFL